MHQHSNGGVADHRGHVQHESTGSRVHAHTCSEAWWGPRGPLRKISHRRSEAFRGKRIPDASGTAAHGHWRLVAGRPRIALFRTQALHDFWKNSRALDRKSTRLNSSHLVISYAVF